jgi:hypothetical protein
LCGWVPLIVKKRRILDIIRLVYLLHCLMCTRRKLFCLVEERDGGDGWGEEMDLSRSDLGEEGFYLLISVFTDQILIFLHVTPSLLFPYFHFYPCVCTCSVVIVSTDLFRGVLC